MAKVQFSQRPPGTPKSGTKEPIAEAAKGVWKPLELKICSRGLVLNEREQYSRYDSIRELINNHYDAGATEVHVTTTNEEIIIAGNGHPIDDPSLLTEVFTDVKRNNKEVVDVSGKKRRIIGEKGRGRFSFVRDADELSIQSGFGELRFTVTGDEIEASMRADKRYDQTIARMRLCGRSQRFLARNADKFVRSQYKFFGGKNFKIFINGKKIRMRVFKPQYHAWLIGVSPYQLDKILDRKFGKSLRRRARSLNSTDDTSGMTLVYDRETAELLAAEFPHSSMFELRFLFSKKASRSMDTMCALSDKVPVKAWHGLSIDYGVHVDIDSDIPLEPSRKGYASLGIDELFGESIRGPQFERYLTIAAKHMYQFFFEKNYKRYGWDKFHVYRTSQILREPWEISVPDLEVEVLRHYDHCTIKEIITLAKLAERSKVLPVIIYSSNTKYSDMVDKLVQMGHPAMEIDAPKSKKWQSYDIPLLEHNDVDVVLEGSENFHEFAAKIMSGASEFGPKTQHEEDILSTGKRICDLMGVENMDLNIATMTRADIIANFTEPNLICFNRANPVIDGILNEMSYLPPEAKSRFYLLMRIAPIMVAELAHYKIRNEYGSSRAKLEHEKTVMMENTLFKQLFRALPGHFLSSQNPSNQDEE